MRLLPWLQEAARRNPTALEHFTDCDLCMQRNSLTVRQFMGCGFAPPPDLSVPVDPWTPPGFKGPAPSTCPGYTTKLPEVTEAARARFHWEKGALGHVIGDEPATEHTLLGIEALAGAVGEVQEWRFGDGKEIA